MEHRTISFKYHNIFTLDVQVVWIVWGKEACLHDLGGENGRKKSLGGPGRRW